MDDTELIPLFDILEGIFQLILSYTNTPITNINNVESNNEEIDLDDFVLIDD